MVFCLIPARLIIKNNVFFSCVDEILKNQQSLLDLVFTNESNMVVKLKQYVH